MDLEWLATTSDKDLKNLGASRAWLYTHVVKPRSSEKPAPATQTALGPLSTAKSFPGSSPNAQILESAAHGLSNRVPADSSGEKQEVDGNPNVNISPVQSATTMTYDPCNDSAESTDCIRASTRRGTSSYSMNDGTVLPLAGVRHALKDVAEEIKQHFDNHLVDASGKGIMDPISAIDQVLDKQSNAQAIFLRTLQAIEQRIDDLGKTLGKVEAFAQRIDSLTNTLQKLQVVKQRIDGHENPLDSAVASINEGLSALGQMIIDAHEQTSMAQAQEMPCMSRSHGPASAHGPAAYNDLETAMTQQHLQAVQQPQGDAFKSVEPKQSKPSPTTDTLDTKAPATTDTRERFPSIGFRKAQMASKHARRVRNAEDMARQAAAEKATNVL